MRLLRRDARAGTWRLRLDTPSDLWRIARFIHPDERVGASSTRRDPEAPADTPSAERSRRRVWLTVRAERIEFHGFSKHVRVSGTIVDGPFDVGHQHTLDLAEGDEVEVTKPEPTAADRALLDEGIDGRGEPTVLLAAVDWGESAIVRLRGRSLEVVTDLRRTLAGKEYGGKQGNQDRTEYVRELTRLLEREGEGAQAIVVAGPGFLKEEVVRALGEAAPALRPKIKVYAASEAGRAGVDELLRSGRAAEALGGSIAAEESRLVEELTSGLAGGARAAVGRREVSAAVDAGAVATLLVSDGTLLDPDLLPLFERAPKGRTRFVVVRDDGPAGRRLKALGGIGAILRYDWRPPTDARR